MLKGCKKATYGKCENEKKRMLKDHKGINCIIKYFFIGGRDKIA